MKLLLKLPLAPPGPASSGGSHSPFGFVLIAVLVVIAVVVTLLRRRR
ncbi:MAG TPA: hypothetical protein VGL75_15870 [Acidothermaceae bacterium]